MVQELAYRGWHRVNRQEELLTGRGRGHGRWQSWRISCNRRWRASCNFTHAWRWWHRFWFLAAFNFIYSLEKMILWCLGSSFFFSHHRWHSSTGSHSERLLQPSCTVLYLGPVPQKLTVPPQIKKIPLPFPVSWISSVLQLLLLPLVSLLSLSLQFYQVFISKLHKVSTQKLVYLLCCQVHNHLTWQCTPDTWTNLRDWTCKHMFTSLKYHNLKSHR